MVKGKGNVAQPKEIDRGVGQGRWCIIKANTNRLWTLDNFCKFIPLHLVLSPVFSALVVSKCSGVFICFPAGVAIAS